MPQNKNSEWYFIDEHTIRYKLFQVVRDMGYEVIAPTKEEESFILKIIKDPNQIVFDYIRTLNNIKHFLYPNNQVLYSWRRNENEYQVVEEKVESRKLAFFAIHPCEANALDVLDKVLLDNPPDPYYKQRRENILVVVLDCTKSDEHCFCESVDSRIPREGTYDLWIVPIDKNFVVKAGSERGLKIIKLLNLVKSSEPQIRRFNTYIKLSDVLNTLERLYDDPIWTKESDKCLLCGACIASCPTCTCFDIIDSVAPTLDRGSRKRIWYPCIFRTFTMITGGKVIMREPHERFKHRYYHKLVFFKNRYGIYGCTGCGRCSAICPNDIKMIEIVKEVISNA